MLGEDAERKVLRAKRTQGMKKQSIAPTKFGIPKSCYNKTAS